jgi:hypothetical protein
VTLQAPQRIVTARPLAPAVPANVTRPEHAARTRAPGGAEKSTPR